MRIQPSGLFHTPESKEEILAWINRHSPEDRAHLMTAMMMTWNYLAAVVNKESGA